LGVLKKKYGYRKTIDMGPIKIKFVQGPQKLNANPGKQYIQE
jgi:hypothetical protein